MFAAYKVGVQLTLVNGVSAGLAGIIAHMGIFDRSVHGANTRLGELHSQMQKIKNLGVIGAGMAAVGFGGLALLKKPLEEATEWERVMARLQQKGLGDGQIADAKKFLRANDIYGVSLLERAKIFDEAQGSFRESGMSGTAALDAAKTMTPVLSAYKMAMSTLNDHTRGAAESSFTQLNKIVELMGGLGDTQRATEIVGGVFKAVQSSGKMVSERDIRQFITMGGSAVSGMSLRAIFGGLEPQMGEFGGSAMGTGLNTAYRLLSGTQSKPSRLFVHEAIKMGLWDRENLVFNSQGGIKEYKGHPFKPEMQKLMREDAPEFAKALMAVYAQHGITSQQDREHENDILLSRTGARAYNKIMLQLSTIESSLNSYDHSQTPDQVNAAQKNSIIQKSIELQKQWSDSMLNFGLVAMPIAIKAIDWMTSALKSFNDFARDNPGKVRAMTWAFIGLSGVLAFGGTVSLLTGAFKGLSLALSFATAGGLPGLASLAPRLFGVSEGLGAISGTAGLATLGSTLGAVAAGFGVLTVATAGLAWLLQKMDPDTDPLEHPGMRRQRMRGRADTWVVDQTLPQEHTGMRFMRYGRGGSWVKDNVMTYGQRDMGPLALPPAIQSGQDRPVSIGIPSSSSDRAPRTGAPFRDAAKQPVTIVINNNVDGKLVSRNVLKSFIDELSGPATGRNDFDPRAGFLSPSQVR